jgi:microcompartment protein CcmK/EutM
MFLAKVTGSVVATQKVGSMTGHKLLTVEPLRVDPAQRDRLVTTGRTFVVVDTVGAGQGEMVLIVQGSSARLTPETEKLPVDATIIHHRHRGHGERREQDDLFRKRWKPRMNTDETRIRDLEFQI